MAEAFWQPVRKDRNMSDEVITPKPSADAIVKMTARAEEQIMEILKRYQTESTMQVDGFDAVRGKIIWRIQPGDMLSEHP